MLAAKITFFLAALCGSALAIEDDSEVSPIEKVITMMEDLMTETLVEGKAEAKTYDKFACFCKDNTDEKTEAINENTDYLAELEATINEQVAKRTSLDNQIAESSTIVAEKQKGIDEADAKRKKDNEDFKVAEADCFTFKKEIDFAVVELMAGEFIQLKTVITKHKAKGLEAVQTAVKEYAAQNPQMSQDEHHFIKTNLLEVEEGSPNMAKKESSATGGVVKTVKELKPGMEETLKRLRADEVQSKHEYQMVLQGLTQEKTAEEKVLEDARKANSKNTEEMAQASKDMTLTQGELTDDQNFLKTLTENCNTKSKMWDQRSKARAEELTALTNAITIVKSRVATKSGKTVRFIQQNSSLPKTAMIQEDSGSPYDEVLQVADEEEDPEAISFLQISPRKRVVSLLAKPHVDGDRIVAQVEHKMEKFENYEDMTPAQKQLIRATALSKVAATVGSTKDADVMAEKKQEKDNSQKAWLTKFLKGKADSLKSTRLAAIAAQVSTTGPFDKITKLIQELIERLMQEAADEANHEGWCNTQLGKAKGSRDRKATSVMELNDALAKAEALRDKLQEETAKLGTEIDELTAVLEKATKERSDEQAENEATIKESEEGKAAVDEALDMLTKFYKTAAKNKVLLQKDGSTEDPDMPDAGFDQAYGSESQGAATGILGMLEVISGDFARTIKTTTAAEKTSAADFLAFETETKTSLAVKTQTKTAKDDELVETIDELANDKESMEEDQSLLDKAIQELLELEPACFPKAEPYEVRVAKREQEIESLKTALCTLDKEGPVQTEAGDCGSF